MKKTILCKNQKGDVMTTRKRTMNRPANGLVGPLPCPFCGSDNLRVCNYGIECRSCGVWLGDGTRCRTIGKTILDAWNHRANGKDDTPK